MAYQKGSDMLLKLDVTGSGSYTPVAAIKTKSLEMNNERVDVTNQDSANKWRELLAGAGIKSASMSGKGVFSDSSVENTVLTLMMAGTIRNWQMVVSALGTFQGVFQISRMRYDGEHNGDVNYDLQLDSAGEITFTAA